MSSVSEPGVDVWKGMDLKELERQYSPSRWSHRLTEAQCVPAHVQCVTERSIEAREQVATELDVAYGKSEKEKLDVFAKGVPKDAPIFVYIHGGYWQLVDLESSSFMATSLTKAGAVVVSVGYDLAPAVTMDEIVAQIKRAVAYIMHMAKRRGSKGVYLCGHSAGAHLAVMAMIADWMSEYMMSSKLLTGAILISGVFDVRPIVKTYINDAIKMTEEDAVRNSPLLNLNETIFKRLSHMDVLIAVGEHESEEFKRQSNDFGDILKRNGIQTEIKIIPDTDHFNVVENLASMDYSLLQDCIKMMKLKTDA